MAHRAAHPDFDPPHECQHGKRLDDHSDRITRAEAALADGRVTFAELRKDLGAIAEKVGALTAAAWWLVGLMVAGLLSAGGTALVWVIQHMGAK
jgi:hypothetical protein